jgi:hypothetical protein
MSWEDCVPASKRLEYCLQVAYYQVCGHRVVPAKASQQGHDTGLRSHERHLYATKLHNPPSAGRRFLGHTATRSLRQIRSPESHLGAASAVIRAFCSCLQFFGCLANFWRSLSRSSWEASRLLGGRTRFVLLVSQAFIFAPSQPACGKRGVEAEFCIEASPSR